MYQYEKISSAKALFFIRCRYTTNVVDLNNGKGYLDIRYREISLTTHLLRVNDLTELITFIFIDTHILADTCLNI